MQIYLPKTVVPKLTTEIWQINKKDVALDLAAYLHIFFVPPTISIYFR